MSSTLRDLIKSKIEVSAGGCWIWTGKANDGGYGRIDHNGKSYRAHRAAFEAFRFTIPDEMVLDHLCRTRLCVNPDHLEPVTSVTNVKRGIWTTRQSCVNGHEFNDANTYWFRGYRCCRECHRLNEKKRNARLREGKTNNHFKFRTHCPQGHPYDEHNTLVFTRPDGGKGRQCKACNSARNKRRREKLKEAPAVS